MSEQKPLNIPLIVLTIIFAILAETNVQFSEPRYYSGGIQLVIGFFVILISPLMILWIRALWNNVVPRITGWREISFWEAAGVSAFLIVAAG